jgi:hypothetical protein
VWLVSDQARDCKGVKPTHVEAVPIAHQRVVEEMPIDLRLDEDEVDEEHDKVMLYVLIAETTAITTDGESDAVAAGLVSCARAPQCANWRATFYADGHFQQSSCFEAVAGVTAGAMSRGARVLCVV